MSEWLQWAREHEAAVVWLTSASLVMFFGTLIVIPVVVARMSPDYFLPERELDQSLSAKHPLLRFIGVMFKNLMGGLLVVVGFIMIFVPGQGLLTILFGVVMLDFPGKRDFELWLVKRKPVWESIGWIRRKAGRAPLVLPP